MTIISLMCFFFCCFQPVANNKIDSCVYEMITVHRHVANYKLINNRISLSLSLSDTVNNKFKRTFFTQTQTHIHVTKTVDQHTNEMVNERNREKINSNNDNITGNNYNYNSLNCHERVLKQKCWGPLNRHFKWTKSTHSTQTIASLCTDI